ncbi:MAG: TetR family transcriptional regulator [Rhodoferax sp.]|nr:TetR family transcriptional regulator [Rhodoferax sp.]
MAPAPTRKQETRERILRTASRALRERGYQGVGVAEVMQEAGLTHGGFYAHFESKTNLLAEATDQAGADGLDRLARAARRRAETAAGAALKMPARASEKSRPKSAEARSSPPPPGQEALLALVDAYLSEEHQNDPGLGCPMAALGSELPRQADAVRRAATHRLEDLVGLVERQMPTWGQAGNRERAMAVLSCLVGTMVLARAVDRPVLAASLRQASRDFLAERLVSPGNH